MAKLSVIEQVRTMRWNFWVANLIEAQERLAFFGVRAILPLYMMWDHSGGLGLSYSEKGLIYMIWALLQTLVPMVSGGYTDAYGYKKSMYLAFVLNLAGYTLMANASGFWSMLAAAMFVGTGTAIFKPPVQGAVVRSLDEHNSALGFGLFYWMVNIGGFFAPMAASSLRGNEAAPTWSLVFYGAAIVTALNFIPAIFLFREPPLDRAAAAKGPVEVLKSTLRVLWEDKAMLRFLLVVSGFWFMFMQLWDLLPNFIDEWVDARSLGALLSGLPLPSGWAASVLDANGAVKPEMLINIDSFAIILFVLPLSWLSGRFKMMTVLVVGMGVALLGFVGSGLFMSGVAVAVMIFVFAIGEILCSPKFSEYIGMTAPADKKALYMGYSNIPFAIGWAAGNGISGPLYEALASKEVLARRWLMDQGGMTADAVAAVEQLPELMNLVAARVGGGADVFQANAVLWDAYQPWRIWLLLGLVGLASVVGMWINDRLSRSARPDGATE
ncbi:MAG: MFS transporter [Deltaproteobacteria bacterium]|nr:MFS transporter [Deltaproteobacteria bacterium]